MNSPPRSKAKKSSGSGFFAAIGSLFSGGSKSSKPKAEPKKKSSGGFFSKKLKAKEPIVVAESKRSDEDLKYAMPKS